MTSFHSAHRVSLLIATLALTTVAGRSATAPFTETFDDPFAKPTLVETVSGAVEGGFSIVPYDGGTKSGLGVNGAGGPVNMSATISLPELVGTGFVETTNFRISSASSAGAETNVGLGALGSDTTFAFASRYELHYITSSSVVGSTGKLVLEEFGDDGQVFQISDAPLAVALDVDYTMSLTGTYSAGILALTGILSSSAGTLTLSGLDTTPLAGTNFGYLVNTVPVFLPQFGDGFAALIAPAGFGQFGYVFDNLSVASAAFTPIPEPSTWIAGAGLLGVVVIGRVRKLRQARSVS